LKCIYKVRDHKKKGKFDIGLYASFFSFWSYALYEVQNCKIYDIPLLSRKKIQEFVRSGGIHVPWTHLS
jgi:uncharacterized protein YktB (UPF0637 family)